MSVHMGTINDKYLVKNNYDGIHNYLMGQNENLSNYRLNGCNL